MYTRVIYWVNTILNRFYIKGDGEHKYHPEPQQNNNANALVLLTIYPIPNTT